MYLYCMYRLAYECMSASLTKGFSACHYNNSALAQGAVSVIQIYQYISRRQEPLSVVLQLPHVQSLKMSNGNSTSNDSGQHYYKWSQQQKRSKVMLLIMWLILILRLTKAVEIRIKQLSILCLRKHSSFFFTHSCAIKQKALKLLNFLQYWIGSSKHNMSYKWMHKLCMD